MNTKEKNSQSIILITGIMRAILILTIVTSYIAMISYLVFYADYYRSIGTMIFYIPLILFSLCPILFFSNKYAVMGIVFSLL
ncbi:hypothetical protein, partial [Francisella philomiragia]|uniref:hypothetical protein n=1 Tax=Francisella philomiragia TaxID=28110 RepID=UPI001F1D61BB